MYGFDHDLGHLENSCSRMSRIVFIPVSSLILEAGLRYGFSKNSNANPEPTCESVGSFSSTSRIEIAYRESSDIAKKTRKRASVQALSHILTDVLHVSRGALNACRFTVEMECVCRVMQALPVMHMIWPSCPPLVFQLSFVSPLLWCMAGDRNPDAKHWRDRGRTACRICILHCTVQRGMHSCFQSVIP